VAAGEEAKPLIENPETDEKIKTFGNLSIALLKLVEALVENGFIPLTGAGTGSGGLPKATPPAPPPKPQPGLKELKDCLEKADTESILFDANLGQFSVGNRGNLCASFSSGIRATAIENAEAKGTDPGEAIRAMNDALECVSEMDFIGLKSEKTKQKCPVTNEPKQHYTMPIKLKFEDRNSHLHFERTVKLRELRPQGRHVPPKKHPGRAGPVCQGTQGTLQRGDGDGEAGHWLAALHCLQKEAHRQKVGEVQRVNPNSSRHPPVVL
jgi:hypothetical protein